MTLKYIMRRMLGEGVSREDITSAIQNHQCIVVTYDTKDRGKNLGPRLIEPYAYGVTKKGNEVIRAYQVFGDSTRTHGKGAPKWVFLRLDRIKSWKPVDRLFYEPRENFNPNSDNSMSIVYMIAKFNGEPLSTPPKSSPKTKKDAEPSVYKTDTERKLERLKKNVTHVMKIEDFWGKEDKKVKDAFPTDDKKASKPGPKMKSDVKKGTDVVYTDDYNYNTFDNALAAAGKRAQRNGHYYFQKRDNKGHFTKDKITDEPQVDDTKETEEFLKTNRSNQDLGIKSLDKLKDKGQRVTPNDLKKIIDDNNGSITLDQLRDILRKKGQS